MDKMVQRYWFLTRVAKYLDDRPAIPVFYNVGEEEKCVHVTPDEGFSHPDGGPTVSYDNLLETRKSNLYAEINLLADKLHDMRADNPDVVAALNDYNANRSRFGGWTVPREAS